ncbi:MAG: HAD family hydrolase [Thermodesulfobacteriota bacterium]
MTERAVFLDRDGVINKAVVRDGRPFPPANVLELQLLPGVEEAIERLRGAGFKIIVVTNQPDVTRGVQEKEEVEAIHEEIKSKLRVDDIRVCYHDDPDGCDCRKPKPGLLTKAAEDFGIDLSSSFMVGDRWRDIDAGKEAGCKTILVEYGYAEKKATGYDRRVNSLAEAAEWIINNK